MKLRTKFSISISLLIIGILVGVAFFLFIEEKNHLENELHKKLQSDLIKFANVCKEASLTNQDITLLNYVATLKKDTAIKSVIFTNPSGKVLMHSDLSFRGSTLNDAGTRKALAAEAYTETKSLSPNNKKLLETVVPVNLSGDKIGVARIVYVSEELEKPINDMLYKTAIRIGRVAVISILVGLFIAYIIVLAITNPIKELSKGAKIIGDGNLEHRIKIKSRDELGLLSEEFNVMAVKLSELDKMKDDFVDSVSHELRSPLAAIKGFVQSLQQGIYGDVTSKHNEALNIIKSNTERLARFVDDVLDIAKIKAGMFELEKEKTDFKSIAEEIITMFKPLAAEMQLNFAIEAADNLPQIFIDRSKVKQIVTNLVNNAMKFTPSGGKVTVKAYPKDSDFIQAEVKDTGVGIPKDRIATIFDKFTQAKAAQHTSKKVKGTGLGLTIAKNIVDMHGGKIWIESQEGKGTSFIFTLPTK